MTNTKLNVEAVKESAANLGRIMDDMSAFDTLRGSFPTIGNFDLAHQLRAIIDDRRNGVVAHADELKVSLDEIELALTKIADNVQTIDDGNAAEILAVVAELRAALGTADQPVS